MERLLRLWKRLPIQLRIGFAVFSGLMTFVGLPTVAEGVAGWAKWLSFVGSAVGSYVIPVLGLIGIALFVGLQIAESRASKRVRAATRPAEPPRGSVARSPKRSAAQRPTRSESPRPTRDNKPRTALPTVPPPPPLPSGYPAPAELARKLRVLATEGDELPSNPTASSDTQAEVREERKRWAHKVKGALESAAPSHHADWFFEAPELTISARNWLQSLGTAMAGGEEEIKSGWRLRNRLAKLRRIIAQLEEASGQ